MKKRKWIYVQQPTKYDIRCDKCWDGSLESNTGTNITWSEYEHKIWCYDCEIDTEGTPGIFDGPIPIFNISIFGISLNRYYLKSKAVCKPVIDKNGRIVYRKIKKRLED